MSNVAPQHLRIDSNRKCSMWLTSPHHRLARQPLPLEPRQHLHLMLLIPAGHDHVKLVDDGLRRVLVVQPHRRPRCGPRWTSAPRWGLILGRPSFPGLHPGLSQSGPLGLSAHFRESSLSPGKFSENWRPPAAVSVIRACQAVESRCAERNTIRIVAAGR